jgi:hypothetical protein
LATAEVLLESGDVEQAATFVGDAGALTQVTGSTYDAIHEKILKALLALANDEARTAVVRAFDARQAAESQAYVAFHFYAMSIEAAARVRVGEAHTGILLATTAVGALETLQGSEYGLYTRARCYEALELAKSPQANDMRHRAASYAREILGNIRDPDFREMFRKRSVVAGLLSADSLSQSVP